MKTRKPHRTNTIKNKFPEILEQCSGFVTSACRVAGISRTTYYEWHKEDKAFADACDEVQELVGDMVENYLMKLIKEKNPSAIIFYSKTKLKNRGYVERVETTGKDGGAIEANVQFKVNKTDERILEEMKAELLAEAQNSIISAQSNM